MNTETIFASEEDVDYLANNDHLSREKVEGKLKRKEYIIVKQGNEYMGFLRFSLFWSEIPYIDVISVEDEHQRKGVGKSMVELLEDFAVKNGQKIIMSSSEQEEPEPQKWHKKIGFHEAGIINDFSPIQDVPEVIFIKKIDK